MTLAPTCYRVEDDSSSTSLFFMIPSPKSGEQPTIVGVKKAQFHWYDNKDILLLELINTQPPDKKLYEVVSGDITLCNLNDSSVLVLASDGEIYYLPITTTVDIFKKLFDNHSIKMLNQTKKGKLTYFTNAVVAQTYIPDQIPETNSEIEQVDAKNLIDEPVGKR